MTPTIAIGDLQGCRASLDSLLDHITHSPDAPADPVFWFCGDIVNRGPDSLGTLRRVRDLGDRAVTVLGNHDLHLLAVAAGVRKQGRGDTIDDILAAPDRDALLDWLRHRPLAHFEHGHLLVHAGVLPQWTVQHTLTLASELQDRLRADDWRDFLASLFGNQPARWDESLRGPDRWRVIVNALTRMRFCTADGTLDFASKDGIGAPPPGHFAWYDAPGRLSRDVTVVTGHWSTLGLRLSPEHVALDTGCVWGGKLTAVQLADDPAARRVWQIDCPQAQRPGN
ncbi:symmetrical bis(5'-nucleosyl)-tetraphosphatase [Derxia gummosa]|uniref:Bis(5'-nucleosyl)-tetraphosphatase, symmetrical n=1 Tax=Derxia gummosa DSM 723 TaxID=1121388 RepID=A0A8B6X295_9BURK|nr:symmetrical bis(5'-nucleosyl)-tetraphosphatase [Derxia gummosa]